MLKNLIKKKARILSVFNIAMKELIKLNNEISIKIGDRHKKIETHKEDIEKSSLEIQDLENLKQENQKVFEKIKKIVE